MFCEEDVKRMHRLNAHARTRMHTHAHTHTHAHPRARAHTHEQDVKRLQELKERILDGEALGEGGKVKKRIKIGGRFVSNAMRRSAKRSLLRGNRERGGGGEGGVRCGVEGRRWIE